MHVFLKAGKLGYTLYDKHHHTNVKAKKWYTSEDEGFSHLFDAFVGFFGNSFSNVKRAVPGNGSLEQAHDTIVCVSHVGVPNKTKCAPIHTCSNIYLLF